MTVIKRLNIDYYLDALVFIQLVNRADDAPTHINLPLFL